MATTLITDAELKSLGIGSDALTDVSSGDRDAQRLTASAIVLSHLKKRYDISDLAQWSDDVKDATARIAAWGVLCKRGFNPQSTLDLAIKANADMAFQWLRDVVDGIREPVMLLDSADSECSELAGPLVGSDELVNWTYPRRRCGSCGDDW